MTNKDRADKAMGGWFCGLHHLEVRDRLAAEIENAVTSALKEPLDEITRLRKALADINTTYYDNPDITSRVLAALK